MTAQELFIRLLNLTPESWSGERGLRILGHRNYVGGSWVWEEVGRLQLKFLVERGLKYSDCLLDIGCGSLRAGRHLINYLDPGKYLGLEKHGDLLAAGIAHELAPGLVEVKRPEFVISSSFEFHRLSQKPDISIAQSVFAHFSSADISSCLKRLRAYVGSNHVCYATFFEGDSDANPLRSHDIWCFRYRPKQMKQFGEAAGWNPEYIGNWGHPRNQMMIRYNAA